MRPSRRWTRVMSTDRICSAWIFDFTRNPASSNALSATRI